MAHGFLFFIFLGASLALPSNGLAFDLAPSAEIDEAVQVVPAKKGFLVRSRIRRNSSRMVESGVRLVYWKPVLKAAFLKLLDREPTPAEYEIQQEQMNQLVAQLVTHTEIDEEGNWNPLPSEPGDYKRVRISGFDVINLEKSHFEIPEDFQGKFLCSEGFCFIPNLFSLRSELILDSKSLVFLERNRRTPGRRKKGSVECPTFKVRDSGPMIVNLPIPKIRHEKIRMLYASALRGVVMIHSRSLTQIHFESLQD
jgi:hypothetical protein